MQTKTFEKEQSMIKLKDIAIATNSSIATVSKALHDSKELAPQTIERIKKKANELGYVPNAFARALKTRKSFTIGVVYVDPTQGGLKHEFFSSILDSVKVEAESRGYTIFFLSKMPGNGMSYLQLAKYRNVDGIVIVTEDYTNPEVIELVNSTIPVVTIDYVFNSATAVMSDNSQGMAKLVSYVHGLGHTKLAVIYGDATDVTMRRLASFHKECRELGIKENPDWLVQGRYHDPRACGRAVQQLMRLANRPTCIFTTDDVAMMGAITALNEDGYKVPNDISVVGYDGIDISRIARPSYTTYHQNSEELGREASRQLIEQIQSPETFTPKVIYINGYVQEGGTTKSIL